jgi:hypothetical protein
MVSGMRCAAAERSIPIDTLGVSGQRLSGVEASYNAEH